MNFAECKQKLITQWYIFYIILSNAPGNRSENNLYVDFFV